MLRRQVQGIGPKDAPIMLIGESPGSTEVLKGEPFCGWSGQFLREMCERAGLPWTSMRVDNVVQMQPPGNKFEDYFWIKREPKAELFAWWTDLRRRILEIRPRVIIAAGDQPLVALTGNRSTTLWRGSVIPYESQDFRCWIIPIVHPSYARRCFNMTSSKRKEQRQPWFHISVYDLLKAKRISEKGWEPIARVEKIFPSYSEVMGYLNELLEMPPTMITVDIETLRREHIGCFGITHTKDFAMCIPLVSNRLGKPHFSLMQEYEIWKMVDKVFSKHMINNQTIAFDLAYFWKDVGMDVTENVFLCTATLHALLYPELKHDLGFLASIFTDMPYFKYLGKEEAVKGNIGQWFTYNCYDVQSAHEIAEKLIVEAKELGMWKYWLNKRLPLLKWAIKQHQRGIAQDTERQKEVLKTVWYEELKPMEDALNEALREVGYEGLETRTKIKIEKFELLNFEFDPEEEILNVNSHTQVVTLLKALGYSVTDSKEETLAALAEESVVAKTILDLRSQYSLLTSISRPPDSDGRLRTAIALHTTETTRLSSTKSHFGTGTNFQNITLKARPLFCATDWRE